MLLHEKGIVFGALHQHSNYYAPSEDSYDERVILVEFDWSRKDGEGSYLATPLNL